MEILDFNSKNGRLALVISAINFKQLRVNHSLECDIPLSYIPETGYYLGECIVLNNYYEW